MWRQVHSDRVFNDSPLPQFNSVSLSIFFCAQCTLCTVQKQKHNNLSSISAGPKYRHPKFGNIATVKIFSANESEWKSFFQSLVPLFRHFSGSRAISEHSHFIFTCTLYIYILRLLIVRFCVCTTTHRQTTTTIMAMVFVRILYSAHNRHQRWKLYPYFNSCVLYVLCAGRTYTDTAIHSSRNNGENIHRHDVSTVQNTIHMQRPCPSDTLLL